jgi:MYXO-CTERM domain-containing protein
MLTTTTLALALSLTAHGYAHKTNSEGAVLHWAQPEVEFLLNTDGHHELDDDAVEDAVIRSLDEFRVEGNNLSFEYMGPTNTRRVEYADGENVIFFEDDWDRIGADETLLALSFVFSQDNGEIIAADVAFNVEHHEWDTEGGDEKEGRNDFYNALSHELGHVTGLGHSEVGEATMAPSTQPGETRKRTLHQDDIDGLLDLYGGPMAGHPMGCSTTGAAPTGALGIGVAAIVIAGLMRRRRDSDAVGETAAG